MEIRHISKQKKRELQQWLTDCEDYRVGNVDFLDDFYYDALRKKGSRLHGNFEVLHDAVSTPKIKSEKALCLEDIDFALDLIEDCHKNKSRHSNVDQKIFG